MIVLRQAQDERERLFRRLEAKAEALAQAEADNRLRARRKDDRRWRRPGLLWPLFAKDR